MKDKEVSIDETSDAKLGESGLQNSTMEASGETSYGIKSQRKRKCSNVNCVLKSDNQKLERLNLNNSYGYYCERCAESIKKKWVCHYCKFICVEGDNSYYNSDWIACDFPKCGRWTHIECERNFGYKNITELLNDQNSKYFCPICRNIKHVKKAKDPKPEIRRNDKFNNVEDFRKTMISKRRNCTMNYTYLHSENYQSIEKLVSTYGNGVYSLMLKENELVNDLRLFNSCLGKTAFEVPSGADKSTSFKPENLEKRSLKKFSKSNVRN
jgi:hypothetical protein